MEEIVSGSLRAQLHSNPMESSVMIAEEPPAEISGN